MGFPSDQTNFDHTFGGRVTFTNQLMQKIL